MNKAKLKFNFIVIVLMAIVCLLFGSIISAFISPSEVFALTNTNAGVKIAEGAELWDSNKGAFNNAVVDDLVNKLFGSGDPITYIKSMKDAQTDSYVVPASTINDKVGNDNGLIVTLDKKEWMVASLTLADIGSKKDNVILTLFLANADGLSQYYNSASDTKGNSAYCRSILRSDLLTNTKWSLFNQTGENSFASQFLVQPKNIKYQRNQTMIGRGDTYPTHLPNEALDKFLTGWGNTIQYNPEDTFSGIRYDAWGDDYIWIPSMAETGATNRCEQGTVSIWQLSANQMKHSGATRSWWRSGNYMSHGYSYSYSSDTAESSGGDTVNNNFGVRPAIHLNISSMIETLAAPEDLETTYDGAEHTLQSIINALNTDWYKKDIYEHADNYIKITYPNNENAFKNAGEYWVKLEITENYTNAVYSKIESDGVTNGWTAEYVEQLKLLQKPRFRGVADTSDTEHEESDTVRWIKITIEKAKIDFSKVEWSADTLEYNAALQEVTIKSGLPSFLTPIYSDNSKLEVNADGTFYTAKVVEFQGEDNNYKTPTTAEIEKISQLQHKWQITKKQIVVSWSSENVTIGDLTLIIPKLNIAENLVNSIEYKYYRNSNFKDEVTLDEIFAENDISQKKSYWVTATLKNSGGDFNSTNCILLVDGTPTECADKRFETGDTINKVEVSLADNKLTFNGVDQQVKFNVTGGGLTADALVVTYKTATGSIIDGLPINAGRYRVAVALKDGYDKYFIVGDSEFEFEIESLKVNKPRENQTQFFDPNGFDLSQVANMPSDWDKYFEIKVFDKESNEILPQNGNWKFVNANKYKIEIHFKNGVNTGNGGSADNVIWSDNDTSTYTVNLEIMPLEFVFEGWEDGIGNKRPTLIADGIEEIEKYFDYVIYEIKNNIIIGNELPQNATLKYNTNYQISLRVKAEFKGNVYLICNDEKIDETPVYKFKTDVNPNPGGGDGSGEGEDNINGGNNNGGNSDTSSAEKWFGVDGKLSLFAWVLIAVVLILFIFLLLMIILISKQNKSIKQLQPFHNNPQTITHVIDGGVQATDNINAKVADTKDKSINPHERSSIVNPYSVSHKDWTFIVKEKDIVNIDLMNSPTDDRVMFYAFKENDLRKLKKFQNQIDAQNDGENMSEDILKMENSNTKKKNKKKGKR